MCVERGDGSTSCADCPDQQDCSQLGAQPQISGRQPAQNELWGSSDLVIKISFNVNVMWCDSSGHNVQFWCDGSSTEWDIESHDLTIEANKLVINADDVVEKLARSSQRQCGISIKPSMLCSYQRVGFGGLAEGAYFFRLGDTVAPSLSSTEAYSPRNGDAEVELDATVTLTFDEFVYLGEPTLDVTLSRLEKDYSGTAAVSSVAFSLAPPDVYADSRYLNVDLSGKVKPSTLYSLSLPRGSVVDSAGNQWSGLPIEAYKFRTGSSTMRAAVGGSQDEGSQAVLMAALGISGLVIAVIVAVASIRAALAYRRRMLQMQEQSKHGVTVPHMSKCPARAGAPSGYPQGFLDEPVRSQEVHKVGIGASWAQPSWASKVRDGGGKPSVPGTTPIRVHPADGGRQRSSPSAPAAAAQQARRGAPGGADKASERQPSAQQPSAQGWPPNDGQRRAAGNYGSASSNVGSRSTAAEEVSPEVRAVLRKMREAMDQPMAVRKKLYKELMLENHPDKNNGARATEVFQAINNARGWFLQEG